MRRTSLKLTDDLKARVAAAAATANKTPHAFMVEAIARETERAERYERFLRDAEDAEKEALESGMAYDAAEAFAYARSRLGDTPAERPKARPWRRSA